MFAAKHIHLDTLTGGGRPFSFCIVYIFSQKTNPNMLRDWDYAFIADITMQLQNKNAKYGRKHILVYLGLVFNLRASLSELVT